MFKKSIAITCLSNIFIFDNADRAQHRVSALSDNRAVDLIHVERQTTRFNKIFNKIAIQGAPQMAVDKEAISLSRVYSYYPKCNLPLFYV